MWHKCTDEDQCKKLFRRLALRLHADHGGSDDLMILLKESYESKLETYLKKTKSKFTKRNEKKEHKTEKTLWKPGDPFEKVIEDVDLADPMLQTLFLEIQTFSKTNKSFKIDFTESILEYALKNKYVTSNQFNALVKIYYTFRMDQKEEKKSSP